MMNLRLDPASETDIPLILALIKEFAEYVRLSHEVVATEDSLRETLFGRERYAEVILARLGEAPVGFAIFFHNVSTFLGKPGLYLEDLFVIPEYRGKGIGKVMLKHLAGLAVERGCGRFEWSVLDWNESAIEFYKRLGAVALEDVTVFRLTGEALKQLADE